MRWLAVTVLVAMAAIADPANATPPAVSKWPGWTSFGPYKPHNPRTLSEIPEPVRALVVAHLKARLGDEFYRRLEFTGGQVVDLDEFHRVHSRLKSYQWEVPAFDLHFTFRMPELGIASYTAQIKLRRDGSVLKEIDLPEFAADARKRQLVPLAAALRVAVRRVFVEALKHEPLRFDPDEVSAEIDYDRRADALVWRFSQVTGDDGLRIHYRKVEVFAHTGQIARVYETWAIR
jgi:hypothetical protein